MIVIIDYNVGNLKSVVGAFKRIGLEAVVSRDEKVIKEFLNEVYPKYKDNKRVDILLNNTDFGVGENKE